MSENKKGLGLFALIGFVVSSCIGSGVYATTGQLANVAAPGPALIAWCIAGVGFLFLALSLSSLGSQKPEIEGIYGYAKEGFGPFCGFISGWGYWLSAWLGNVGFGTMIANVLAGAFPAIFSTGTAGSPNFIAIVGVSAFLWLITFLVINGVESAAFLNAVVMVVKIASIAAFIIFCIICFQGGVFTADFWGQASANAAIMAQNDVELGSVTTQVINCILIMMWMFIGIEGATVMNARAERKSDVGKATVIGLITLLVLYIGATILPYGVMPYEELIAAPSPATVTVFDYMAPGWGGTFMNAAIIISVLGCWLSFTMLPAETSSGMSNDHLLPASWNKMNAKNAPQMALIIVGACTQVFLVIAYFAADAYTFAISMCTVTIIISWSFAAAYQIRLGIEQNDVKSIAFGGIALLFQVASVVLSGWVWMLLACLGYIPGFIFYGQARKEAGAEKALTRNEMIGAAAIAVLGIISIPLTVIGVIPVF
ncbi:Arginine/ornithine antiporter [Slackia heliotrinireducens]|uniref:Amino acid transporter n=1 Tax=Slackia heliotrinireducens (strain ATCC 29202 / DSM 20476 / NCTC 11029 / RHS 1) TaxID=471855 RepID=C7N123_SLAHD|nr:basic amino acid/polyamine antiporter [Slackia heliotrinireducens]ACV23245.1 amino acid transporter [Slackia heliotrinireducens DSM 20476]VEH02383.1 Arginine/ornithine antiporter [Slackia heliotrinireducens]